MLYSKRLILIRVPHRNETSLDTNISLLCKVATALSFHFLFSFSKEFPAWMAGKSNRCCNLWKENKQFSLPFRAEK